ncbi:hypothetical protein Plhal304r1_c018g0064371 [Plasmopara halstedii]
MQSTNTEPQLSAGESHWKLNERSTSDEIQSCREREKYFLRCQTTPLYPHVPSSVKQTGCALRAFLCSRLRDTKGQDLTPGRTTNLL